MKTRDGGAQRGAPGRGPALDRPRDGGEPRSAGHGRRPRDPSSAAPSRRAAPSRARLRRPSSSSSECPSRIELRPAHRHRPAETVACVPRSSALALRRSPRVVPAVPQDAAMGYSMTSGMWPALTPRSPTWDRSKRDRLALTRTPCGPLRGIDADGTLRPDLLLGEVIGLGDAGTAVTGSGWRLQRRACPAKGGRPPSLRSETGAG